MKELIFILIALSSLSSLRSQDTSKALKFLIDPTIKDSIDKYSGFSDGNYGKLEFDLYFDDELILSTSNFPKAQFGRSRAILRNDKLLIQGINESLCIGFELLIDSNNNSALQFLFLLKGSVLKEKLSDTLSNELKIDITSPQVIFASQPRLETEEVILGIIQFVTPEFYVFEGEEFKRWKYEVKYYFKSKVIEQTSQ